jgi:hypothetical protein
MTLEALESLSQTNLAYPENPVAPVKELPPNEREKPGHTTMEMAEMSVTPTYSLYTRIVEECRIKEDIANRTSIQNLSYV